MADAVQTKDRTLVSLMRKQGWNTSKHDGRLTGRAYHIAARRSRWWDWGHPVMILVGTSVGGNYAEPTPPTWWYRQGPAKSMARTGFPLHPLSTYEIITDYETFSERTGGLNEDQMHEWQAICVDQDGDLILGHRYWGGNFYSLSKSDTALLRRYLRMWRRLDWFGLRSWLYKQALHAAVHQRKPFACHAVPSKGSGGYDHWHCTQRRRHPGRHQFNNYLWDDDASVEHVPAARMRP